MKESIKELFSEKGRNSKSRFFNIAFLVLVILSSLGHFIEIASQDKTSLLATILKYLSPFLILILFGVSLSNIIRRLHDLDKNEWWALICIIPYVNLIFLVYLLFSN